MRIKRSFALILVLVIALSSTVTPIRAEALTWTDFEAEQQPLGAEYPPLMIIDTPLMFENVGTGFTVSGWALSNPDGIFDGIAQVEISLDGAPQGSAQRHYRPDVKDAVPGYSDYSLSGFSFDVNAVLDTGIHMLTATALDHNGNIVVQVERYINISDNQAKPALFYVDSPRADTPSAETLDIVGWALSTEDGSTDGIDNIEIYIDDSYVGDAERYFRPDLIAAIPGYGDYLNGGFRKQISGLSIGYHHFRVVINLANGEQHTASFGFNVSSGTPKPYLLHYDTPPSDTVLNRMLITGWALFSSDGQSDSIGNIEVFVNNVSQGYASRYFRPDLVEAIPDYPDYSMSGFEIDLDMSAFDPGEYIITLNVMDDDDMVLAAYDFETEKRDLGPKVPLIYIDTPARNSFVSSTIDISGWALYTLDGLTDAIGSVQILVDMNSIGVASPDTDPPERFHRPDVEEAVPDYGDYSLCGFSKTLDTTAFQSGQVLYPNGLHTITVRVWDKDGQYIDGVTISVNIGNNVEEPRAAILAPLEGDTVNGKFTVYGYTLATPDGINDMVGSVELFIDTQPIPFPVEYIRYDRSDLMEEMPGYGDYSQAGFSVELDISDFVRFYGADWQNSEHLITLVVRDAGGMDIGIDQEKYGEFMNKNVHFGYANADKLLIVCDRPQAYDSIRTDQTVIEGWALFSPDGKNNGIGKIEVFVDEKYLGSTDDEENKVAIISRVDLSKPGIIDLPEYDAENPDWPNGYSVSTSFRSIPSGEVNIIIKVYDMQEPQELIGKLEVPVINDYPKSAMIESAKVSISNPNQIVVKLDKSQESLTIDDFGAFMGTDPEAITEPVEILSVKQGDSEDEYILTLGADVPIKTYVKIISKYINLMESFAITQHYIPVSDITNLPPLLESQTNFNLTGTVVPNNATAGSTIVWAISEDDTGETGAVLTGDTIRVSNYGNILLTATVVDGIAPGQDFVKEFEMEVFVPVINIAHDIPSTLAAGSTITLNGEVTPGNATNQTVIWTLVNADPKVASLTGSTLRALSAGVITIKATILNGKSLTEPFEIEITLEINEPEYIAVNNIVLEKNEFIIGDTLSLSGIIEPSNASQRTIRWQLVSPGSTGANLLDPRLTATGPGTITVKAIVEYGKSPTENYEQTFEVTAKKPEFIPVQDISGGPYVGTVGVPFSLTAAVTPTNATNRTIEWFIDPSDQTDITKVGPNSILVQKAGIYTVTARIVNGKADEGSPADADYTKTFSIEFFDLPFIPVMSITVTPAAVARGSTANLNGLIAPANATNKTIDWSIISIVPNDLEVFLINGVIDASACTKNGVITVQATIKGGKADGTDFTTTRDILIEEMFIPVTGITGIPLAITKDVKFYLTNNPDITVVPENATNKEIEWATKKPVGVTEAHIETDENGTYVIAPTIGSFTLVATIKNGFTKTTDFVKEFAITVNNEYVPITGMQDAVSRSEMASGNDPERWALAGDDIFVSSELVIIEPENATNQSITWSIPNAGTTGASLSGDYLSTTSPGTLQLMATVTNGTKDRDGYIVDYSKIITIRIYAQYDFSRITSNIRAVNGDAEFLPGVVIEAVTDTASYPQIDPITQKDTPPLMLRYQWLVDGTAVALEGTGQQYTIQPEDAGKQITCIVTCDKTVNASVAVFVYQKTPQEMVVVKYRVALQALIDTPDPDDGEDADRVSLVGNIGLDGDVVKLSYTVKYVGVKDILIISGIQAEPEPFEFRGSDSSTNAKSTGPLEWDYVIDGTDATDGVITIIVQIIHIRVNLSVSQLPIVEYIQGDKFELAGTEVLAIHSDGNAESIPKVENGENGGYYLEIWNDDNTYYMDLNDGTILDRIGVFTVEVVYRCQMGQGGEWTEVERTSFQIRVLSPSEGKTVIPAFESPLAGEDNLITITILRPDGNVDTTYTGEKEVTIEGFLPAPDGTYGWINRSTSDEQEIFYDNDNNDPDYKLTITMIIDFVDGIGSFSMAINNARLQLFLVTVPETTDDTPVSLVLDVVPGIVAELRTFVEISDTILRSGSQFGVQPVFELYDQFGNLCINDNTTQIIAEEDDLTAWTLTGLRSVTAEYGMAMFFDLGAVYDKNIQDVKIRYVADVDDNVFTESTELTMIYNPDGSRRNPFLVYDLTDLRKVGTGVDGWTLDSCYRLIGDITMPPVSLDDNNFEPIGNYEFPFTGQFDGNNHKIIDLILYRNDILNVGMFGATGKNAVIKNLTLETGNAMGSFNVGGIVGYNTGKVLNCVSSVFINDSLLNVGGVVGYNNGGTVKNSMYKGYMFNNRGKIGGVVGYNLNGIVEGCYNTAYIGSNNGEVGGVVGGNHNTQASVNHNSVDRDTTDGVVSRCWNTGKLENNYGEVGGVVGSNNFGFVSGVYAQCDISGYGDLGGVLGFNEGGEGALDSAYFVGTIKGSATSGRYNTVGGVVANNWGHVDHTYSKATLDGYDYVGGIVGYNNNLSFSAHPAMVLNSVALNDSITARQNEDSSNPARIGRISSVEWNHDQKYYNNYSIAGTTMTVISRIETIQKEAVDDISKRDGKTLQDELDNQGLFMSKLSGGLWMNREWSFETTETYLRIFEWDEDADLPKLVTVEEANGTARFPFIISTADDVAKIGTGTPDDNTQVPWNLTRHYKLVNDIDMDGETLSPIGAQNAFTGEIDGDGYAILNAEISGTGSNVGFIGILSTAKGEGAIRNFGLINCTVTSNASTIAGALAGFSNYGTIENSFATGTVTGGKIAGGLVGRDNATILKNSYFSGTVMTSTAVQGSSAGGLIGISELDLEIGYIQNCYAKGIVSGTAADNNPQNAGGLIGSHGGSGIYNCYSANRVTGLTNAGGIVGYYSKGAKNVIVNSAALNPLVSATSASATINNVGRIIGYSAPSTPLDTEQRCYARSDMRLRVNTNNIPVIIAVHNNKNGESVLTRELLELFNDQRLWSIDLPPAGLWDFEEIWTMQGMLPVLKWQLR